MKFLDKYKTVLELQAKLSDPTDVRVLASPIFPPKMVLKLLDHAKADIEKQIKEKK